MARSFYDDNKRVDNARMKRELGVTLFTIGISGPDYPLDVVREWLVWRDQQNA